METEADYIVQVPSADKGKKGMTLGLPTRTKKVQ